MSDTNKQDKAASETTGMCLGKRCIDYTRRSGNRRARMCTSRNGPELPMRCTLPLGHAGRHIACGEEIHDLASWD